MRKVLIFNSLSGFLAVLIGALSTHYLKKIITPSQINSLEISVRYLFFHSAIIFALAFYAISCKGHKRLYTQLYRVCILMAIGMGLFSYSIIILVASKHLGAPDILLKIIGPITPMGGIFLLASWSLLILVFFKFNINKGATPNKSF